MPGGLTCTDVTNIDMICDNVVMTRPYTLLDYEWTFEFPVPCEFVLYRIIHYYIQTHKVREVLNAAGFYEKFGISEVMRTSFQNGKRFSGIYYRHACSYEGDVCHNDSRGGIFVPE